MQAENQLTENNRAFENEQQGVTKVVHALLVAYRNCTIYPEGHTIHKKSLDKLLSDFNDFLPAFDHLRLHVEKERLLYFDTVVYVAPKDSQADDIIFQFYRDGIQWIEFQNGLVVKELAVLFKILSKYHGLAEETEGDIVTDFTDEDFSHISLKATDPFWDEKDLIDFSNLNKSISAPTEEEEPEELEGNQQLEGTREKTSAKERKYAERQDAQRSEVAMRPKEAAKSIADHSLSDTLWELTSAEKELLDILVLKEENWDKTEDIFDVLIVVLDSQKNEQRNFESVLRFIMEEVIEAFELKKFSSVLKLFQDINQLVEINEEINWIKSEAERFYDNLSKPETFNSIVAVLLNLEDINTEQVKIIRKVLFYFSPEIISIIGPILLQKQSHDVQKMIQEVIEYLSTKDLDPLEQLLNHSDEAMGAKLLGILGRLQWEKAKKIFYAMLDHPADKVRRLAIRNVINNEPYNIKRLFPFIKDPYKPIQEEIFAWLSRKKSKQLETLLIRYMKKNLQHSDPDHILTCYTALGHCGSASSISFLHRILLKNGWNSFIGIGKLIHRQGASCALILLDTREAKNVLIKASKSKFPVVRRAFQKAMATIHEPDGQSNE
jgi:hypothetical protein